MIYTTNMEAVCCFERLVRYCYTNRFHSLEDQNKNYLSLFFSPKFNNITKAYAVYFRRNPTEAQPVEVYKLRSSNFNSSHPTKLIIHGYNSDMDLDVLVDIRKGES